MRLALKDKVLVLLSTAALISLALGFYQDFGIPRAPDEPPVDWVEGVAIMIAIFIVFCSLNEKKEERGVKVIHDRSEKVVDIKEVVVGDIALVEPGEIIPCDGIFLGGHNVKCDESGATGESDAIKKVTYDECLSLRQKALSDPGADAHIDCFVVSGSKVLEGVGRYVIVAVGQKSFNGRIMMALRTDAENTPLQLKLNRLAELIAQIGSAAGLILFASLMIRQLGTNNPPRIPSAKSPPQRVFLSLAFATKRMTYENLLVWTGGLTQNDMTVVAGWVGLHAKFVHLLEENEQRTNANRIEKEDAGRRKHVNNFSIDQSQLNTPQLRNLFNEAITVNSTAFQDVDPVTGKIIFIGSKTETALLKFTRDLGWPDFKKTRDAAEIIQMTPFSSDCKAMGVVIRLPNGRYRIYLKGASEILSRKCTRHVVVHKNGDGAHGEDIETRPIDPLAEDNISRTIIFYANQMLRTIAICYRDLDSWPPCNARINDADENLTLIGIPNIEDPLRPGIREVVAKCAKAGVSIRMCTGDNVLTARSIVQQRGISTPGVLARSSPEDKKTLVQALKAIGKVVGVTGDGTNDGLALKTANVGFSMGIAGTEVAKEAHHLETRRCVNDSVCKFLQFQISTNVTPVASAEEFSVSTAVQLLWINIIMDMFAALALATDPATKALLDRKPDKKTVALFTKSPKSDRSNTNTELMKDYELACKMATDALELNEEDIHDEHPSQGEPFRLPGDWDILTMLSGETQRTLRVGLIISALVLRPKLHFITVRLDSRIEGVINAQYISDQPVNDTKSVVSKDQTTLGVIIDTKFQLEEDQFFSELANGDGLSQQCDPRRTKKAWGERRGRRKRAEVNRTRHVIKHPNFHNFDAVQGEAYLESQQRGDVVIRPSSKGFNHLAVTWKVDDGLYQPIDVTKTNAYSTGQGVGGQLIVDAAHTYTDLDGLIVIHVQAMARQVEELMAHEKFESLWSTY
ncbi:hypothetical protein BDN72DRAFT_937594 [Pluteus cervinus]|uniref:Uncharacterized protein n=1 Tax=Pluteus cervinus TaxID=181527 RepID=A0ACD3A5M7_9AGAR|nr:hypothetical protein BDN72DRAFT_937594 [Pluteus cervinus]